MFIIGVGRSGTTILTQLLNNHPSIHCMPEANFLLFFLHRYGNKAKLTQEDVRLIFEQIALFELSHPWVGWSLDKTEAKEAAMRFIEQDGASYDGLCKLIYGHFKVNGDEKKEAVIYLDKNPSYTLFTRQIERGVPGARFILISRDPRANILSRKQSVYLESPHVAYNAFRWKMFTKKALKFGKSNPDKFHLIRYEDLAAKPEEELKKVCRFIGVDENVDLLHALTDKKTEQSRPEIPAKFEKRFEKKYSDLAKPVNAQRIDSWKTSLSVSEIELCDLICADVGNELGYTAVSTISFIRKVIMRCKLLPIYLWAWYSVEKEYVIYRMNIGVKLGRLRSVYKKHGFNVK